MFAYDRQTFIEEQRGMDRNGRLSNNDLERMADFEELEIAIANLEDLGDVRTILFKLVELVRAKD